MAYTWVSTSVHGPLPHNAVQGGYDADGSPIYVGLAHHQGDELPAKVIPRKRAAYVCWNGKEIAVTHYKVMCQPILEWVPAYGGVIPAGAVPAGRTRSGETLYIGRTNHAGSQTIGKVHPSHGTLYIPFGGNEIGFKQYEILVAR